MTEWNTASGPVQQELDPSALNDESRGSSFLTVGAGASAGGLDAFGEMLRHLPPGTGMAIILVQHPDPGQQSATSDLISSRTAMPVVPAQNGTLLKPDHVYIAPAQALISIDNLTLKIEPPAAHEPFRPVDTLFKSLADNFQSNAIGMVLSGTEADGTLGLKAIKAAGGITFAQNQTAKFDAMPRSAISAGVVDFILAPRRIAEKLTAIADQTEVTIALSKADAVSLKQILLLLRRKTGIDFTQYKQPMILRRLHRRILLRNAGNTEQYIELLQKEPAELKTLFDDLLINVTGFFRDTGLFEALARLVLPSLAENIRPPSSVRVWVPGCASGEEVYSLAIQLSEFLEAEGRECGIQIFGTDISENAIAKARAGVYDSSSLVNVSPERLQRFFIRTAAGYQVNRAIREVCVFSRHNVASDPPLSRMNLISCRNLLIYLSPALQKRIMSIFGYALQPSGFLVLGPSETLRDYTDYFETIEVRLRIYRKRVNVPQSVFRLTDSVADYTPEYFSPQLRMPAAETPELVRRVQERVDQIVLSQYGPAALVVEETLRIVEYRGDVRQYLAQAEPQPGADLMNTMIEELRAPLATAIDEASRTGVAVLAENLADPGAARAVPDAITVIPLSPDETAQYFLILFTGSRKETPGPAITPPMAPIEDEGALIETMGQENARLRREAKASREYLQSVIEELRATNDEAQAANEELQSTNEEMQTSKEELQSSNEELNTINAEMQNRNAELARTSDDLTNLLGSMNLSIVMVDNDLLIRRFTPRAERVLSLAAADLGRSIASLKPRIDVPNLEEIFQSVLDTLQPWEQEVQDRDGNFYLMRVRPYRTADNRIDGAVLQLPDVTELKHSMAEVQYARDYAEAIVNTVREPLVVLDRKLAIQNANPAFYDTLQLTRGTAIGASIYEVAQGRLNLPQVRALLDRLHAGSAESSDIEIQYRAGAAEDEKDGLRILSLNARSLPTPDRKQLVLLAFQDITERKLAAEARYRRLFESARDGIVLVDAITGEIININPFTEQLLGYTRDELAGRKIWEIEPIRAVPKVRAAIERIRDQGYFRLDDLRLRTKDGQNLQTEMIASVYSEGDRRAIQFNIRDVSERKKFERELQETQKLESLGLLAGGIAHDFNNLLTGILGNASLAYSELPGDQKTRRQLREIIQASERAAFLTRQMLAYAGRGRISIETFDLAELILDISALVRSSISKTIELRLDLTPGLPLIEADVAQIQQVVMNLIINAAEAIGEAQSGKVEIRTSLLELDPNQRAELFGSVQPGSGTYIQMEVTDNGCGMDEATSARIFDPFFTTKFAGRGLGLAAVQGILRAHSGAIRVYSTPGHGSSFVVLLPARNRRPAPKNVDPEASLHIRSGGAVLVVDDEETVRSVVATALSSKGLKVLTAENGKAAVELFREHNAIISVVLLDLQMPVMGGEEAFRLMNKINPKVPVILSSGYDESEAAGRFPGNKPARFLQKPYTTERLIQAVAAASTRPD